MKTDRIKWDNRYTGEPEDLDSPDEFLLEQAGLLTSGRALDLASGLGANSVFLAQKGYCVDALDISFVALSKLGAESRRRGLNVRCATADLDSFPLPVGRYDLVIVFYFFSEPLIMPIMDSMKPRGLLIYATFNERHISVRPEFNPVYLVKPDALAGYFPDFEILIHETDAGEAKNISRLVARKTA